MIVCFSAGASEIFAVLPGQVKRRAARSIELLVSQPRMYPVRSRGVMRGYRYFVEHGFLFYCSVSSGEVRIAESLARWMRLA